MTQVLPTGEHINSPEHAVIAGLDRTFMGLGGREGDSLVGMVGPEVDDLSGAMIRAHRRGSLAVQWAVNVVHGDTDFTVGYGEYAAHVLVDDEIPDDSVPLPSGASVNVVYAFLHTDWAISHPTIPRQRPGS
jgi:hypothetical protein